MDIAFFGHSKFCRWDMTTAADHKYATKKGFSLDTLDEALWSRKARLISNIHFAGGGVLPRREFESE